eukprot:CAMPEP_0173418806 /NCGR_PEP_ID=MMETSP1357-20121228/857_1 /TAXON_ID=77926 /ORGANISM="Hemiselmis rufescens, Strain PCC563" /LENGTH=35 /DNA_ID= /DNA_START= /DNA_END= /DNA_ORIENTATION=
MQASCHHPLSESEQMAETPLGSPLAELSSLLVPLR